MMISTKGRYALRVLINMAERQTTGYVPLKEIAAQQDISEKYLESIVKELVKGHVLEGLRGKGGGYRLTKTPDQYTAGSIIRLMEGTLAPVACLEGNSTPCARAAECRTLPLWKGLNDLVNDYLDQLILAAKSRAKGVTPRCIDSNAVYSDCKMNTAADGITAAEIDEAKKRRA